MARLAVDLLPLVAVRGVVADEDYRAARGQVAQQEVRQLQAEVQAGPGGRGQDALVVGAVARCHRPESAEEVGDGAPAGGEDGGDGQQLQAQEGRRGAGGDEEGEDGQGLCG